jgi:abortive infection bacteriophage resistance protein
VRFDKPPLPLPQQLAKWQSRGLVMNDATKALHYLQFIGYYRFSAYTLPFQDLAHPDKHFRPGTTFELVLGLYVFDRELRLLVLDAIERVEVAVRACLVNEMCLTHGSHWFMDAAHFRPPPPAPARKPYFDHSEFLDNIDAELGIPDMAHAPSGPHNEVFINHYYAKYGEPYLPPAWMVFEVLSMNRLSQVFANLKEPDDRNRIANHFGVDEQVLQKWLHCLSYVRNLCAHHRRLWNVKLVIKPLIAKKHATLIPELDKDKYYAVAIILHYLMGMIAPQSRWHERLANLMVKHSAAGLRAMGFPPDWRSKGFWGLNEGNYSI